MTLCNFISCQQHFRVTSCLHFDKIPQTIMKTIFLFHFYILILYYTTSEKNDTSILTSWRGGTKFEAHKTKRNSTLMPRYSKITCHQKRGIISYHIIYHIISFIFLLQIHTGLQNPYGYGNCHIFRNQVKATRQCTTIVWSGAVLGFRRIRSIQYHKYNKIAQYKFFSVIKGNKYYKIVAFIGNI